MCTIPPAETIAFETYPPPPSTEAVYSGYAPVHHVRYAGHPHAQPHHAGQGPGAPTTYIHHGHVRQGIMPPAMGAHIAYAPGLYHGRRQGHALGHAHAVPGGGFPEHDSYHTNDLIIKKELAQAAQKATPDANARRDHDGTVFTGGRYEHDATGANMGATDVNRNMDDVTCLTQRHSDAANPNRSKESIKYVSLTSIHVWPAIPVFEGSGSKHYEYIW